MTQPWSKEIDDDLQPGMARLFASDNSESKENQTLVSDKNTSEKLKYGNSVDHQGSVRTQSKPIFNINNHVNSKQENLHQNQSSSENSLNFNPKIQSNRALSSMLRKIQSRQNDPQYQNKFLNVFDQNPSQLSNKQGMPNQNPNNFYPNQGIPSNTNPQNSFFHNSKFKNQTNKFENSNKADSGFLNNSRNSSFQENAKTFTNNPNQEIPHSSKLNFQKSNYTGKYPIPPPPKLPPEGREIPPFLSFGSDEGINPYQIEHKNPYDSTLTDVLSESISGNKRFSSNDEIKGKEDQKPVRNNNYNNNYSKNTSQNNQFNTQNRIPKPNDYHKSRIDQVNNLKRINLRNQTTSLFANAQNQESMNREPSYNSLKENNNKNYSQNYSQNGFGLHKNHINSNQSNQFGNVIQDTNVNRDSYEEYEQKQFVPGFNDSYRSNSQQSNNFGSIQPNSLNFQNSDTRNNYHRKALSLKERLYKPSTNNSGFQGYSQENHYNNENNFEPQLQHENARFRNEQQKIFSNFSQNNSLQDDLQDSMLNNTINTINEIEEDPEQRELTIIENLNYIKQAEPVKLEILHLLMDRHKHPDCQLLREIKRNRYMGTVALGMILYNLIETFGSDMISKNYEEGNDIYYISERFSDLLERAFNI